MKCYLHPDKDAIYECSSCGKPICEACMRFDDDDHVVCPACTLESAVQFADEDLHAYIDRVHQLHEKRTHRDDKVDQALRAINGWYILVILALIGVNVYLHHYVGQAGQPATFDSTRFAKQGDPAPEMTYLLAQLFAYANDHGGRYPEKLRDLFPQYIDHPPRVLNSADEDYVYTSVNGPEGFVLNLPRADRFGYRKLYATAEGVLKFE